MNINKNKILLGILLIATIILITYINIQPEKKVWRKNAVTLKEAEIPKNFKGCFFEMLPIIVHDDFTFYSVEVEKYRYRASDIRYEFILDDKYAIKKLWIQTYNTICSYDHNLVKLENEQNIFKVVSFANKKGIYDVCLQLTEVSKELVKPWLEIHFDMFPEEYNVVSGYTEINQSGCLEEIGLMNGKFEKVFTLEYNDGFKQTYKADNISLEVIDYNTN